MAKPKDERCPKPRQLPTWASPATEPFPQARLSLCPAPMASSQATSQINCFKQGDGLWEWFVISIAAVGSKPIWCTSMDLTIWSWSKRHTWQALPLLTKRCTAQLEPFKSPAPVMQSFDPGEAVPTVAGGTINFFYGSSQGVLGQTSVSHLFGCCFILAAMITSPERRGSFCLSSDAQEAETGARFGWRRL